MENHNIDALLVRSGHTKQRGKSTRGRSKSSGRFKSPGDPLNKL